MLASVAILASCSDQLDTLPDNRTTLDTPKKIAGLLVTAYPDRTPTLFNEWMSDNTDYMGRDNSLGSRGNDQYFFWQEQTEGGNDSPEQVWMLYYEGVYKANEALAAIENQGGPKNDILRNSRVRLCFSVPITTLSLLTSSAVLIMARPVQGCWTLLCNRNCRLLCSCRTE